MYTSTLTHKCSHLKIPKLKQTEANLGDLSAAVTSLMTLFGLRDLNIGGMTSKNNRAPKTLSLISQVYGNWNCNYRQEKLKEVSNWRYFVPRDRCPWQTTSSLPLSVLCIISSPDVNSNRYYCPEKYRNGGKICLDLCDIGLWPLTWIVCMGITFVNGNYSWKFNDDTVKGTL